MEHCYELAGIVGVLPGELTLRELLAMSNGRRRFLGELAAWQIVAIFGGNAGDVMRLNPYGERRVKTKAEIERENETGWNYIKIGLFGE